MFYGQTNVPVEFAFTAELPYKDIFNEVEVDVVFTASDGREWKVPAFWAGDNDFRVRFAAPEAGRYTYKSVCSNSVDKGLHGQSGEIEVRPYEGNNQLYKHGRLKTSQSRRTFEQQDGTPFFWLGDTWWMGLCKRLEWPGDFKSLAADRAAKGYSVVQIVAGLYPDMPAFDERGANEAGFPWEKGYTRINPGYFDMADIKIEWLVRSGFAPCIVGCWAYFLPWTGMDVMKKHWRNLVARYGAYPVAWCLAGEGAMPYYLSETKEEDRKFQISGWTEMAKYVRAIDPYHNVITIHPVDKGRDQVDDPSVLDFEMLQTGHSDKQSIPSTVDRVVESYSREPRMPFINSEVCYEGIGDACRQDVQRFMFWSCMLSGAGGHTYGANGIWQVNRKDKPYGPSPHGMSWGNTPWDEAAELPGSAHLGIGKKFLERYEWWQFEPHPEWVDPHWNSDNYIAPFAAGISGKVRVIYLPVYYPQAVVKEIEPGSSYRAFLFNPVNGEEQDLGMVAPDSNGDWKLPLPMLPIFQDWVLVLEA